MSPDVMQAISVLVIALLGWFARQWFGPAQPKPPATPTPPSDPIDDEAIEYVKAVLKDGWKRSAMDKIKQGLKD